MSLQEMHKQVYQNKVNKGFNISNIETELFLFYGEMAEEYKTWRKKKNSVCEELADVAIYLLGLAEIPGVDLAGEIEKKMAINKERTYAVVDGTWKRQPSVFIRYGAV